MPAFRAARVTGSRASQKVPWRGTEELTIDPVRTPGKILVTAVSHIPKGTDKLTIEPVRTRGKMLITVLSHIPKMQRLAA